MMKTMLPWLIAALALGGAWFFHKSSETRAAEVARLQQEVQELSAVREENEALKTDRVPREEVEQLRKDNRDLLRLRNEIQQLRNERQQLTQQAATAQAAAQQAQAQAQAVQTQAQALTSNAAFAAQSPTPEMLEALRRRYGVQVAAANPEQAQRIACVNQLRQLDGAKQQWALENRKTAQDLPTPQDVLPYLRGNAIPKCPADGVYTLNRVGERPVCSIPGHALPQ